MYDLIVVGAGIAGTETAVELANKGFKVALIEACGQVLPPSSTTQNECNKLHTGMHYLGDSKTAEHCLIRAIEFAKKYPEFIAGQGDLTSPCRRGRHYIIGESLVSEVEAEKITNHLRSLYEAKVKEDPTNKVFGEVENFIQQLDPKEYNFISNTIPVHKADGETTATSVTVAYETAESQVDIPALQRHLQQVVDEHENITFIPNSRVVDLGLTSNKFGYYAVMEEGEREKLVTAKGIVNCTWQNIEMLDKKIEPHLTAGASDAGQQAVNRVKVSLLVKLPKELANLNTCIFSSGPFFSITNLGDGTAILTSERLTNVGFYPSNQEMPIALKDMLTKLQSDSVEAKRFADEIIADCAGCFNDELKQLFLQAELLETHVGFVKLLDLKETYTQDAIYQKGSSVHARQLDGVFVKSLGYISNSGMKMTYAVNNAKQVSQHMAVDLKLIGAYEDFVRLVKNNLEEDVYTEHQKEIDLLLYITYRDQIIDIINQSKPLILNQEDARPTFEIKDDFNEGVAKITRAVNKVIKMKENVISPYPLGMFNSNQVNDQFTKPDPDEGKMTP